jgi:thioesterase domain-containing protein
MSIETLQGLTLEEQISRAHAHLQRLGLVVPELSENSFRAMLLHFRNNLRSLVEYKAKTKTYENPATLFVVEDYPQEWLAYWQRIAPRLNVIELKGTHYSIWVDPQKAKEFHGHLSGLLQALATEPCAAFAEPCCATTEGGRQ